MAALTMTRKKSPAHGLYYVLPRVAPGYAVIKHDGRWWLVWHSRLAHDDMIVPVDKTHLQKYGYAVTRNHMLRREAAEQLMRDMGRLSKSWADCE